MSQSIRYQVFVSSTFTDLREERAEVLQAIWELDCIPTGMEAFLATNESQWEVIQKVIDECDYYVIIIGGRYGSVTADGISYTEKEYVYAKSLGIPILGFVHGDPDNIPAFKTEKEEQSRILLEKFRTKLMEDYPVRRWTTPQELGGVVSRSISRSIKVTPRPGWIRNTGPSNFDLLDQINVLNRENFDLKSRINEKSKNDIIIEDLASGSDGTTIYGIATVHNKGELTISRNYEKSKWTAEATWDDLFREIGPVLLNEATDSEIKTSLSRFVSWSEEVDIDKKELINSYVTLESFSEIIVQFRALGLITKGLRKRAVSDNNNYWGLTESGEKYLVGLLAKRRKAPLIKIE